MWHLFYTIFGVVEPNFGVVKSIKGHLRSSRSLEVAREGWEVAREGLLNINFNEFFNFIDI